MEVQTLTSLPWSLHVVSTDETTPPHPSKTYDYVELRGLKAFEKQSHDAANADVKTKMRSYR